MRIGTGVLRRKVIPWLFVLLSLCRTGVLRRKVISDCSFCCLYVELVCCDVKWYLDCSFCCIYLELACCDVKWYLIVRSAVSITSSFPHTSFLDSAEVRQSYALWVGHLSRREKSQIPPPEGALISISLVQFSTRQSSSENWRLI